MKKIFFIFLGLILFSNSSIADDVSCKLYRADGPNLIELPFTAHINSQPNTAIFHLSYTNNKPNKDYRGFTFSFAGKANKKVVEGVMSSQGNMGVGSINNQATWTVVNSGNTPGYIRAKKGKHPQLGKGILGEAVFPFVNEGKKIVVNCFYNSGSLGDCFFCF